MTIKVRDGHVAKSGLARRARLLIVLLTSLVFASPANATASSHPREAQEEIAVYPTGKCDTLKKGLIGLNDPIHSPSEIQQIGTSVLGRPIWAERWGPEDASTIIQIVSGIHGYECSPNLLVDEIRNNPPKNIGIWLIPVLNPDGYANFSRGNANGVDLNDDGLWFSQPETRALMDFTVKIKPTLTIHIHSPNAFVGVYGKTDGEASKIGRRIAKAMQMSFCYAGARKAKNTDRRFLWQGQAMVLPGHESLLVELFGVTNLEAPKARPRPPTTDIKVVRRHIQAMLQVLDS